MGAKRSLAPKFFAVAAIFYIGAPALLSVTSSATTSLSMDSMAQREARNSSSFAIMMGEFRTSLGDMLFVKTERYLDSGVGYEPHIDAGELAKSGSADKKPDAEELFDKEMAGAEVKEALAIAPGEVASHEDEHDHEHDHAAEHEHEHEHEDHEDHEHADHGHDEHGHDEHGHDEHGHDEESTVATLIRTADDDFRGFIGHLEREVKPWRDPNDPHQHTAGTELLPWYRLATLSDPHNVRNYMIGAWWLKTLRTPEQREEALDFLNEGIAANPNAYELYLMKGYVLRESEKVDDAMAQFKKSADVAIKTRPPEGPDSGADWDITDEEQMAAAMTMHIILTRDTKSTATALQLATDYIRRAPHEPSLHRVKKNLEPGN